MPHHPLSLPAPPQLPRGWTGRPRRAFTPTPPCAVGSRALHIAGPI